MIHIFNPILKNRDVPVQYSEENLRRLNEWVVLQIKVFNEKSVSAWKAGSDKRLVDSIIAWLY
jgi:hypothetical protein